jgi:hypothetical protein
MPFTNRTKPTLGHTTKKSEMDASIDNENWLNSQINSGGGGGIGVINGSLEDGDIDEDPDGWEFTAHNNGTGDYVDDYSKDGVRSYYIVAPDGGANGGGILETSDYIKCPSNTICYLKWWMWATVAAMRNAVHVRFFDRDLVELTPQTVYDEDTTNPLEWTLIARMVTIPATAVYMKIKLEGGVLGHATGGGVYFDAIGFFIPTPIKHTYISASGNFTPTQATTGIHAHVTWAQPSPTDNHFGAMTNVPYVHRLWWYEQTGGEVISYILGSADITEFGAFT